MLPTLALGAALAMSDSVPDLVVPDGWGVNIHFNDPKPGEMERLAGAGFRWIRQDLSWQSVETSPGKYDFEPLARLFDHCERHRIRPLIILDYGNDLYQTGAPRTPEARAAFVRMVEALMTRFKGRGAIWEMWNEPNIKFWSPQPNVDEYIVLAKEVGEAIRRVAPGETYVGPATSGFDWTFLERCFAAGLLELWDAVTVHPYRPNEPESVALDWIRLRRLIQQYGPPNRTIPMISGEWGYSELYSGMNRAKQGQYIVRQYLANLMSGVPLSIWYDWKDDGPDPKEPEHHFGAVAADLSSKPAYAAVARTTAALRGYRYHLRIALPAREDYLVAFRKGSAMKFAAWTTGRPHSIRLPYSGASAPVGPEPAILTPVKETATLRLIRSWRAVPPALYIGESADADAAVIALRRGMPAGTQMVLPRKLRDTVEDRPLPLRVRLIGKGAVVEQETLLVPTRPVSLDMAGTANGLEVTVKNPGGRILDGFIYVRTPSRTYRSRLQSQRGATEYVVRIPVAPRAMKDVKAWLTDEYSRTLVTTPTATIDVLDPKLDVVDDGDPKLKGTYAVTRERETRVRYTFPPGWKFVMLRPQGGLPLAGRPRTLSMRVWSDGRGDLLRMRFTDATGQTFQPDAGPLDWKGWRRVTFRLDDPHVGRWGGAGDGVIHLPIRIDAVALVDSAGGRGGVGEFAVRDLSVAR